MFWEGFILFFTFCFLFLLKQVFICCAQLVHGFAEYIHNMGICYFYVYIHMYIYIYIYTYIIYISIYTACNWWVHIVQLMSQPLGQSTENVCLFCLLEKIQQLESTYDFVLNMQTRVFLNSLSSLSLQQLLGSGKRSYLVFPGWYFDAVFPTKISRLPTFSLFWDAHVVVVELRSKVGRGRP